MKEKKLISIFMTTYNHEKYIEQAVESVISQIIDAPIEIVISDDASSDGTQAICENLARTYSGVIRYFRHKENIGLRKNFRFSIHQCEGAYLASLSGDDYFIDKRHLQEQLTWLEGHPEYSMSFAKAHIVSSTGDEIATFPSSNIESSWNLNNLLRGNFIPSCTQLYRRDAIWNYPEWIDELLYCDYAVNIVAASRGKIHFIDRPVSAYRRHDSGVTNNEPATRGIQESLNVIGLLIDNKFLNNSLDFIARLEYVEKASLLVDKYISSCMYDAAEAACLRALSYADSAEIETISIQNMYAKVKILNIKWGFAEWLSERQPTAARTAALLAIIAANSEIGTLGVAIIDTVGNRDAIEATLDSIRVQLRAADGIWVVTPVVDFMAKGVDWAISTKSWSTALNARLQQDAPDYLLIVFAGDVLLPHALLLMGEHRLNHPALLAWYMDEDVLEDSVPVRPMLKPDFNLDLLRSYPYIGRTLALSTATIHELGGLDPIYGDLCAVDLIWRIVEYAGPPAIGHIPEVLVHGARSLFNWVEETETNRLSRQATQAHLGRMEVRAEIIPANQRGLQRIQYNCDAQPLVSIIIPTRDQLPILRACVDSLMASTAYTNYELLIVDNGSVDLGTCEFLAGLEALQLDQVRVLRWSHPFNYSSLNNFAVQHARGEILLFLNNDIQATNKEWLSLMLGHALRPEIGLVGARLDYPDGRVQHGGLVLGMDNSVGFAFQGLSGDLQGYMSRLQAVQNVSALSAACMMMRRTIYDELGGFDSEAFPIYYGDADLCMKATQVGYLLVIVPDTGLIHMGGATRLLTEKFGLTAMPDDEQRDRLYAKWLPQLARDPTYHPAFGKFSPGFDLSPDASRIQEPLPGRPLPVVLASHADWHGCGHYRIIQPFQALEGSLQLEGGLKLGDFHFTDVVRIQPDVIVLQGAWAHAGILKQIQRYRESAGAKVALEFDDYVPNIPVQSMYRKLIPQSAIKQIRRAMERVDWLVVSTSILAEEYAGYHSDIRIAKNGLYLPWWQGLQGERRVGKKMRVGWAGGSSHTGDLAEIRALVKDMEHEVEWVFMGMQPKDIQCEFHPGVPIKSYPEKLASLNLDLAVVPLELNQFNRSKSNLRLLELGACGVPVICTDIEPYRCDLPVTRVRNRYQDWAEAIRSHLAEAAALARQGDALREVVLRDWVLEGDFLDQWSKAWLPQ